VILFHRFLIGTAIAFCALFSVWGWREYQASHTTWALASSIAFGVFTVGFAVYLAYLKKFLGR